MNAKKELHLKVYENRSELIRESGDAETFHEGTTSEDAKVRYDRIRKAFHEGYLDEQIRLCKEEFSSLDFSGLSEEHITLIDSLVDSVTSEVGRALIGLAIMQLTIKSIEPVQSIRLHKSSSSTNSFSWKEGVSMRSLDKAYVTPALRNHNLVKLNVYGFMMTRSLAENYPYSQVYKAQLKGARKEWINLVELVENGKLPPQPALHHLIAQLMNRADEFTKLAAESLQSLSSLISKKSITQDRVIDIMQKHMAASDYAARIMEISMHSLFQAMQEESVFPQGELVPISQMRSANKKHGNIGDIEIKEGERIIEAWDAKFGKTYLRDEIEELADKIKGHPEVRIVGFVSSNEPVRIGEMEKRLEDFELTHDVRPTILSYKDWVAAQFQRSTHEGLSSSEIVAEKWLTAYVESLAQKRTEIAPIDEPCFEWLSVLRNIMESV